MKKFETEWSKWVCSGIFEMDYSREHMAMAVMHSSLKKVSLFCLATKEIRWEAKIPRNSVAWRTKFVRNWLFIEYHGVVKGRFAVHVATGMVSKFNVSIAHRLCSKGCRGVVFFDSENRCYWSLNPEEGVLKKMESSGAVQTEIRWTGGQVGIADSPDYDSRFVVGRVRDDGLVADESLIKVGQKGSMVWMHDGGILLQMVEKKYNFQYLGFDGRIISEFSILGDYSLMYPAGMTCNHLFVSPEHGGGVVLLFRPMDVEGMPKAEVEVVRVDLNSGNILWRTRLGWNCGQFVLVGDQIVYAIARGYPIAGQPGDEHDRFGSRQIDVGTGEVRSFIQDPLFPNMCPADQGLYFSTRKGWLSYGTFVSAEGQSAP